MEELHTMELSMVEPEKFLGLQPLRTMCLLLSLKAGMAVVCIVDLIAALVGVLLLGFLIFTGEIFNPSGAVLLSNCVMALSGAAFAIYCYSGVRALQYSTSDVFFKWKIAENCGICMTMLALLGLNVYPWYYVLPISIIRAFYNVFACYVAKSYSTRLKNGEIVLVTFGAMEHVKDRKSLILQSPHGKNDAGIQVS
jgi:hypothetical protein